VLLVVGSRNSSNSNRLVEIGRTLGARSFLIDGPGDMDGAWFEGVTAVGVTAGASAPEVLVQAVIARLRELGGQPAVEAEGQPEQVVFALPKALRATPRG
jgi:4-hydroxy-3-methylbut-2-enyl diphosphate reductase